MKKLHYVTMVGSLFLIGSQALGSENLLQYLSPTKQKIQQHKADEIEANYSKEQYGWINPVEAVASYNINESALENTTKTKSIYLNLYQDVFRSGGIYYQMHYAKEKYAYDKRVLSFENASLNQELFTTLLNIKKAKLQLEQSQHRIDNYEIDIFLKQQQYLAGDVDITLLNSAIMDRNKEQQNYMSIKTQLGNVRLELKGLTDKDEDAIAIPQFELVDEADYLQGNYNIEIQKRSTNTLELAYKQVKSSYLPTVTVNGQYGYGEYYYESLSQDYDGDYYSAGIQLSIPLDFNTNATLQASKSAYLKQQTQALDEQHQEMLSYQRIQNNISNYKEYIELTHQNLALYKELIDVTSKAVKSGYKAGYDLKTLEHTQAIDEYEIAINECNIQIELAKLHFTYNRASYENTKR